MVKIFIFSLLAFHNQENNLSKLDVDMFVLEQVKDETFRRAWHSLTFTHFEPQFWGGDAEISNKYLIINYLATKGSLELYSKMANCSFPFYRAISAIALQTFDNEDSATLLEKLSQDNTEVLFGGMAKETSLTSYDSIRILEIAKGLKLSFYKTPSDYLHFIILKGDNDIEIGIPE